MVCVIGISKGPLTNPYTLEQFHFHWGKAEGRGGEHTVSGNVYDAEVRIDLVVIMYVVVIPHTEIIWCFL